MARRSQQRGFNLLNLIFLIMIGGVFLNLVEPIITGNWYFLDYFSTPHSWFVHVLVFGLPFIFLKAAFQALKETDHGSALFRIAVSMVTFLGLTMLYNQAEDFSSKVPMPDRVPTAILTQLNQGENRIQELVKRLRKMDQRITQLEGISEDLEKSGSVRAESSSAQLLLKAKNRRASMYHSLKALRDQIDSIKLQADVEPTSIDKEDDQLLQLLKRSESLLIELQN